MKKLIIIILIALLLLCTSCDFIKDRFLDGEPLYGGGHQKDSVYTPSPPPSVTPTE